MIPWEELEKLFDDQAKCKDCKSKRRGIVTTVYPCNKHTKWHDDLIAKHGE